MTTSAFHLHGIVTARRLAWMLVLLALVASTGPAAAADASAWDRGKYSAVRLIAGGRVETPAIHSAGIEIQLSRGWKTYWRYPGDSGIPPRFDFKGSQNLAEARVLWPAPQRFSDDIGYSIGYSEHVIFPVRVRAADPAKPVLLKLNLDYAICEKMCVPASAKLELPLTGTATAHAASLHASESKVPKSAAIGEGGALRIKAVRIDPKNAKRVVVTLQAQPGLSVDLFAEGPGADWNLPLPRPDGDQSGTERRFVFDLEGIPPNTRLEGARLLLTAVSERASIEVAAPLD
jgi:DsbC/DsbD-like thiol-disulfide interchange protein